jgi:GT2 family glycosyltransferase
MSASALDPRSAPALSIVVVAYRAAATIERCLEALARQRIARPIEIVVVASGPDETADLVAEHHPGVRLVRSPARLYPGAARNLGIAAARSDLIGFVDADCVAAPDWAERVLAAQRAAPAVVGGTVDNGDPESAVGWAQFFCEFHQWMPGTPAGAMSDIPTCCYSLGRSAFDRHGPFRTDGYCSDTAFNWRLGDAGDPPRLDPTIQVAHIHATSFRRFLAKQWMHGRAFARMRVAERSLSPHRRAGLVILAPALPVLLWLRLLRRVLLERKRYRGRLVTAAPLVFVGLCCWSIGEAAGYLRSKSQVSATTSV